MPVTVDGKHILCTGRGTDAYPVPQESDTDGFDCGCRCHHDGRSAVQCPCGVRHDR